MWCSLLAKCACCSAPGGNLRVATCLLDECFFLKEMPGNNSPEWLLNEMGNAPLYYIKKKRRKSHFSRISWFATSNTIEHGGYIAALFLCQDCSSPGRPRPCSWYGNTSALTHTHLEPRARRCFNEVTKLLYAAAELLRLTTGCYLCVHTPLHTHILS